jgi:hypothetical protein
MHEDPSGMLARIPFGLTTGPIEGAEILRVSRQIE